MSRVQDLDPITTIDNDYEIVVTNPTTHISFRQTLANLKASFVSIASLAITTLFQVTGDTELSDTEINGDLEVNGDIIQNGQAYETHAEKVYTKDDNIFLRDGAVSGLPTGKYAGIIAKHYNSEGDDGALVFDKTGEARVGDYLETEVTVYSPDGTNFFTDSEMTEPATIPAGVTPELVSGIEYKYTDVDDDTEPLLTRDESLSMLDGGYLQWDGIRRKAKTVQNVIAQVNKIITDNTTISGIPLETGSTVSVMFTADITGIDTVTGLSITYNNENIPVKVNNNGTLVDFVAFEITSSPAVYKYLQANTILDFVYDGTQFIIAGNPIVLSGSDYTVYADGNFKRIYSLSHNTTYIQWAREIYDSKTKRVIIEGLSKDDNSSILGTNLITPKHTINTTLYPSVGAGINLISFTLNNSKRIMYRYGGIQADGITTGELLHIEYFAN